jgi:cellulose synthase/poly-beta-1,6-N-acetylglucosamine synthase-like glycosyltransferase
MLYGSLVHQVARLGHLQRRRSHRPTDRGEIERCFEQPAPALVILVPSYKEEPPVVRQTLWSAALQEHPERRVVLLIDDPPEPGDAASADLLSAARALPAEIGQSLEKPAARFEAELEDFLARDRDGELELEEETQRLARLNAEAAAWFEGKATNEFARDHTDRLFIELVFRAPARAHLERTLEFEAAGESGPLSDPRGLLREYRRLAARFRVQITSFERKRYVNLSHEPNKAMNLNSYIGLLGRSLREVERGDGLHLESADPERATLHVPEAVYVLTLDADSLLAPEYALRLSHLMSRPENARVAVAQTPYSAVPGAVRPIERIAGATTDIQYILHQGFGRHGAAYWVGANALLRKAALDDLKSVDDERGFEIARFIQDRTVIEDTESSVDLIERGWTLVNHPERLAYSATPADFGALLIQRRRWANGGLIILPKLLRYLWRSRWSRARLAEGFLRIHYLTSIAGVNAGLLVLLAYPFDAAMHNWLLPLAALPYFAIYARDLSQIGYCAKDVVRAYALNLLLLPVNLGGVLGSVHQAVTGRKSAFGRTPKTADRTAAPTAYLLAECGFLGMIAAWTAFDLATGRWAHAIFGFVNGGLLLYAMVRFVGVRAGLEDLGVQLRSVDSKPRTIP